MRAQSGADWSVQGPCAHLALIDASLFPFKYICLTLFLSNTLFKSAPEFTVALL